METDSRTEMEVEISDTQSHLKVSDSTLSSLVRRALALEGCRKGSISILIVDDPTIRSINARHLGHDWPTDVITFPLSGPDDEEVAGELVVSAEMAVATASEVGADPLAELALYLVHGLLHLRGYDDQSPEESGRMRDREDAILRGLGLVNTFGLVDGSPSAKQAEVSPWPL